MASNSVLSRDWDSNWRPVRDLAAVALVVFAAVALPYALLVDALLGAPLGEWGAAFEANAGLVVVAWLWTLVVLAVYGGPLRSAYRTYRRAG